MLRLHGAVQQQQHRFMRPPLGPLGALLSVADQRWAGAIDAALKYTLEAWVVHSRADQKLLMVRAGRVRAARGERWEWHCFGRLGALPKWQSRRCCGAWHACWGAQVMHGSVTQQLLMAHAW